MSTEEQKDEEPVVGPDAQTVPFVAKYHGMKEIQRCVAMRAYERCFQMGKSKDQTKVTQLMYKFYHGFKDNKGEFMGYCKKLFNAEEMFEPMFETDNNGRKRIQEWLLPVMKTERPVFIDNDARNAGISMALLHAKSKSQTTFLLARTMYEMALDVCTLAREMYAILEDSPYKNGKMPSGTTWEDYVRFCSYKHYKMVTKAALAKRRAAGNTTEEAKEEAKDDNSDDEDSIDEELDEATRLQMRHEAEQQKIAEWNISKHVPTGFLGWILWGHILPEGMQEEYKSKAMCTNDRAPNKKAKKANGRSSTRAEAVAAKKGTVKSNPTSVSDGSTLHDEYMRKNMAVMSNVDRNMFRFTSNSEYSVSLNAKQRMSHQLGIELRDQMRFANFPPDYWNNPDDYRDSNRLWDQYCKKREMKDKIDEDVMKMLENGPTSQVAESPLTVPNEVQVLGQPQQSKQAQPSTYNLTNDSTSHHSELPDPSQDSENAGEGAPTTAI